jgi:hypothetical protein
MIINIKGINGSFIDANIKAFVGMTIPNGTIEKVNSKSLLVKNNNTDDSDFKGTVKINELNLYIWELSDNCLKMVTSPDGKPYIPNDKENALITLCNMPSHEAIESIGAIANNIKNKVNLRNESINDVYGSLSEYTIAATIDQLINK